VLRIPPGLDLASAAPLLCAGITTYSPLVYYGAMAKGTDAKVRGEVVAILIVFRFTAL